MVQLGPETMKVNWGDGMIWIELVCIIGIIDHKRSTILHYPYFPKRDPTEFVPLVADFIPGIPGLPCRAVVLIATSQVVCRAFLVDNWGRSVVGLMKSPKRRSPRKNWWFMITDGHRHPENIWEWTLELGIVCNTHWSHCKKWCGSSMLLLFPVFLACGPSGRMVADKSYRNMSKDSRMSSFCLDGQKP